MKKMLGAIVLACAAAVLVSAQDAGTVVHGTVKKVDAATKTVVIAASDGTEQVLQFGDNTVVHGTAAGSKDAFHGLKEGSEVAAHYSTKGTVKTAVEVDNIGKGGLKAAEGTVTTVGAGGKTVAIKTADGTEQVFDLTGHAAAEAGKGTATGVTKTSKVTVYYTEEGGKKVAHFFKKI